MLRHPLTHSWVPVPEAKSNSGRWFRSTSGGLGRKSVVGARCPSCTTVSLLHHFTPARKTAWPYKCIIRSDGCGYRGVAGFQVGNGRQGAHFGDSRCHGMLQKKGKLLKDA